MPDEIRASAFGKINLTLAVTGRRSDGYHTLCSVMQSISLCDDITVRTTRGAGIALCCDDPLLPAGPENAAFRAAETFLSAAGVKSGIAITLHKRIPYRAGLGSASADAAGTLAALDALFGNPLGAKGLQTIAPSVGADVAFCLLGGTRLAEGIGEILSPLPGLPDCHILLVLPGEGVSTAEAYRRYDRLADPRRPDASQMAEALKSKNLREIGKSCGNVFEQCCPVADVFDIKERLLGAGALGAAMSGSGTAVFGLFEDPRQARAAAGVLAGFDRRLWLVQPSAQGVKIA